MTSLFLYIIYIYFFSPRTSPFLSYELVPPWVLCRFFLSSVWPLLARCQLWDNVRYDVSHPRVSRSPDNEEKAEVKTWPGILLSDSCISLCGGTSRNLTSFVSRRNTIMRLLVLSKDRRVSAELPLELFAFASRPSWLPLSIDITLSLLMSSSFALYQFYNIYYIENQLFLSHLHFPSFPFCSRFFFFLSLPSSNLFLSKFSRFIRVTPFSVTCRSSEKFRFLRFSFSLPSFLCTFSFSQTRTPLLCLVYYRVLAAFFLHQYFLRFTFSHFPPLVYHVFISLWVPCVFPSFNTIPVIQPFYFFLLVTFYLLFYPFCLKATLHSLHSRLRKRDAFFVTQFPSENQFSLSKRLTRAFFFTFPSHPLLPLSHLPPSLRDTPKKSPHRRVEHLLLLIIYATNARVSSLDFLLSREEIDRFSFTPLYSLLLSSLLPWNFRSSTFALSYRLAIFTEWLSRQPELVTNASSDTSS